MNQSSLCDCVLQTGFKRADAQVEQLNGQWERKWNEEKACRDEEKVKSFSVQKVLESREAFLLYPKQGQGKITNLGFGWRF